eukprot:CAMPEP_0167801058 /NCGR_PEP_ID=MMETSP0111_2-20121227/18166_1 /TAXON_ID=91324 /ORGANISM="Lotharella globosa, Strain CCCM811" /LENGTH=188 /DNA_ID=CAMNT_0007696567 /DNA_START=243 /DNA_END=809 /DNA_ORIENTATION=+
MSVVMPPASASPAEANNGICGNCKKPLTQGGTTYLYRDQTYCSAHCRAMQMTPSSSASSDTEAGAKPWMIPKFKQKQDKKTKTQDTRTTYYSSKAGPYGSKRWDPVFRSPSTEFLSKYAVKARITRAFTCTQNLCSFACRRELCGRIRPHASSSTVRLSERFGTLPLFQMEPSRGNSRLGANENGLQM